MDGISTTVSTELSGRDQCVIRETSFLLAKTMRPTPGAQSRPRANPERERRGTGRANRAESTNPPAFIFADHMLLSSLASLLLGPNRMKALRTQRSDATWCHIAVDLAA